jgi:hypothetical protein
MGDGTGQSRALIIGGWHNDGKNAGSILESGRPQSSRASKTSATSSVQRSRGLGRTASRICRTRSGACSRSLPSWSRTTPRVRRRQAQAARDVDLPVAGVLE